MVILFLIMHISILFFTISRYNVGAYISFPSYAMRTRGSKDQLIALKVAPKKQLDKVFKVISDAILWAFMWGWTA